jgi:hypothetical protein
VVSDALTLERVLGDVRRGKVAYLSLTAAQKRAFREPDGAVALDVVRHLLGARPATPKRFPLTEGAFQAVARKLGHEVAQKRCRHLIALLRDTGVIETAGHYRQPYRNSAARSGFCVLLFCRGCALRSVRVRGAKRQRPVGKGAPVKRNSRLRWWQHPLFGDPQGLPPPPELRRMKSLDEVFQGAL